MIFIGRGPSGGRLWVTDGTVEGSWPVAENLSLPAGDDLSGWELTPFEGKLLFAAQDESFQRGLSLLDPSSREVTLLSANLQGIGECC